MQLTTRLEQSTVPLSMEVHRYSALTYKPIRMPQQALFASRKKNTHAVVAFLDKAHAVALLFEELESIRIDVGDSSIEIDNEQNITINEGSHTTIFGDTLHQELNKMSARIDGIINVMKALPPVIVSTAKTMGMDNGSALTTAVTPLDALQKETFGQIENDKIKH